MPATPLRSSAPSARAPPHAGLIVHGPYEKRVPIDHAEFPCVVSWLLAVTALAATTARRRADLWHLRLRHGRHGQASQARRRRGPLRQRGLYDSIEIPADGPINGMFTQVRDLSRSGRARSSRPRPRSRRPTAASAQDRGLLRELHRRSQIEAKGLAPLQPQLDAIAAIKDRTALAAALGQAVRGRGRRAHRDPAAADLKQPDVFAVYRRRRARHADRDYYLDTKNPKFADVRTSIRRISPSFSPLPAFPTPPEGEVGL